MSNRPMTYRTVSVERLELARAETEDLHRVQVDTQRRRRRTQVVVFGLVFAAIASFVVVLASEVREPHRHFECHSGQLRWNGPQPDVPWTWQVCGWQ